MSEQPKSDRTSVTISKRVHQQLKMAAATLGVTQRSLLERIIVEWTREARWMQDFADSEELKDWWRRKHGSDQLA